MRPGGATTTGPDATPPPAICQNLRGGQLGRGGGGGLHATHYYNMHTSRVCVCLEGLGGIEICMR